MLHILVVDRLNLETLLSHEARKTRIKTKQEKKKKPNPKHILRRHKMNELSKKRKNFLD
jgi:hypothetical protein